MSEYYYKTNNMTIDNGFTKNIHRTYVEDYFDKIPNIKKQITLVASTTTYYETLYQPANTFISAIYFITDGGTYSDTSQNIGIGINSTYSATNPGSGRDIFDGSSTNILSNGQLTANTIYSINFINRYSSTYRPLYLLLLLSAQETTNTLTIYIEYKDINSGTIVHNNNYYLLVKNNLLQINASTDRGNADSFISKISAAGTSVNSGSSRITYSAQSSLGDSGIDLVTGNLKDDEIVLIPNYYGLNTSAFSASTIKLNHSHHEIEWECAIGFPASTATLLSADATSNRAQLTNNI